MAQVNMEFPNNSDKSREAPVNRPPMAPIVDSSRISSAEDSTWRKVLRAFINPDAVNVKDYLINVGVKTAQNTIMDLLNRLFNSTSTGNLPYGGGYKAGYTNYTGAYKNSYSQNVYNNSTYKGNYQNQNPPFNMSNNKNVNAPTIQMRGLPDYHNIIITPGIDPATGEETDPLVDSNKIVNEMRAVLANGQTVHLSDFYRLINLSPDYTMEFWGWEGDPRQIDREYVPAVGGWRITMPDVSPVGKDS